MMKGLGVWRGYDEQGDLFGVGWLDETSQLETADPSVAYVEKLTRLCADPVDFERSYNASCPVAPSLILHYVTEHRYKAPEFVDAVLRTGDAMTDR